MDMIYGNKLVNTIETKPFSVSSSNLADTILILEVKGQGHNRRIWK